MRREELYGPRLFSTTLLMHAAQTFSAPAAGAFLSNGHTGMFPAFYCYCFSSLSSRLMDNDRTPPSLLLMLTAQQLSTLFFKSICVWKMALQEHCVIAYPKRQFAIKDNEYWLHTLGETQICVSELAIFTLCFQFTRCEMGNILSETNFTLFKHKFSYLHCVFLTSMFVHYQFNLHSHC